MNRLTSWGSPDTAVSVTNRRSWHFLVGINADRTDLPTRLTLGTLSHRIFEYVAGASQAIVEIIERISEYSTNRIENQGNAAVVW